MRAGKSEEVLDFLTILQKWLPYGWMTRSGWQAWAILNRLMQFDPTRPGRKINKSKTTHFTLYGWRSKRRQIRNAGRFLPESVFFKGLSPAAQLGTRRLPAHRNEHGKSLLNALFLPYSADVQATVDLKQMSLPDKLRLMEALWDELCSAGGGYCRARVAEAGVG